MLTSAWARRNPRVKQGTLQVVTDAITVVPIALSLPATWMQLVLQPAAKLLDDPNRCRAVSPDIPFCLMTCFFHTARHAGTQLTSTASYYAPGQDH